MEKTSTEYKQFIAQATNGAMLAKESGMLDKTAWLAGAAGGSLTGLAVAKHLKAKGPTTAVAMFLSSLVGRSIENKMDEKSRLARQQFGLNPMADEVYRSKMNLEKAKYDQQTLDVARQSNLFNAV